MLELTGQHYGYQDFKFRIIAGLPQGENFEIEFDEKELSVTL
jgi:hypothetical protein